MENVFKLFYFTFLLFLLLLHRQAFVFLFLAYIIVYLCMYVCMFVFSFSYLEQPLKLNGQYQHCVVINKVCLYMLLLLQSTYYCICIIVFFFQFVCVIIIIRIFFFSIFFFYLKHPVFYCSLDKNKTKRRFHFYSCFFSIVFTTVSRTITVCRSSICLFVCLFICVLLLCFNVEACKRENFNTRTKVLRIKSLLVLEEKKTISKERPINSTVCVIVCFIQLLSK